MRQEIPTDNLVQKRSLSFEIQSDSIVALTSSIFQIDHLKHIAVVFIDLQCMDFFIINVGLNNYEQMFFHLEEALKAQAGIFFLKTSNVFRDLRKQSTFQDLMTKYGYK